MTNLSNKASIKQIESLLGSRQDKALIELLSGLHPADIADLINHLSTDDLKKRLFFLLDVDIASEVIVELSENVRRIILRDLAHDRLADIVEDLPSDEAADIIGGLPKEKATKVLEHVPFQESVKVKKLLKYPEETAGGLMQTELLVLPATMTVEEAIREIRQKALTSEGEYHTIFVINEEKQPVGLIPLHRLISAHPTQTLSQIMESSPVLIHVNEDREEVAKKFRKYDLVSAPVIDHSGILLGRITIDDIMDVVEKETSEDFYRLAGTDVEEVVYGDNVMKIAQIRLPWLLTNLFGGLFTGYLMWLFKVTLSHVLVLVTFIPVITGMGGNLGLQSSTISVRGWATGRISLYSFRHHLFKEIKVALLMAAACGLTVGIVAYLWHGGPSLLGIVVGLSMFCAMNIAVLMGTLMPAILRRLGIDPAVASGPFVTTANDIVGILVYMVIATIFLKYLW